MTSRGYWAIFLAVAITVLGVGLWLMRAGGKPPHVADAALPADFEETGSFVMACHELVSQAPEALAELVGAVRGRVRLVLLVASEADLAQAKAALAASGIEPASVEFLTLPHESSRINQYGPLWISRGRRGPALVETWRPGEASSKQPSFARTLAEHFQLPLVRAEVHVGGNLLTNGRGLALTTTTLEDENAAFGLDAQGIEDVLRRACGIKQLVLLEPLEGEPTGQVRTFATFVSADTVLVGAYDPLIDKRNAHVLDRNAELLASVEVEPGKPLTVKRIPMPPRQPGVWRSYTTVVFVRDTLLVPVYPGLDRLSEEKALDTYRQLLPQWNIVPISAHTLAVQAGALRSLVLRVGAP
jgi:agmatine/peptidylarginine deiminase